MHFAFKFFSHTCFYHRFFASRSSPFPTRWLRANTFPTLRLTATPLLPFPLVLLPLFNLWTSTISTSYNYAALWIKSLVLVTNHFLLQSLTFLYIRRSVNAYAFTHSDFVFAGSGFAAVYLWYYRIYHRGQEPSVVMAQELLKNISYLDTFLKSACAWTTGGCSLGHKMTLI